MAEDYEAVYTHPSGAMAIFTRRNGSLDAVARGLDAEQFWTFKNVKSLLVRNDEEDLADATRQMAAIGFSAQVRTLEPLPPGATPPAVLPDHAEAHAAGHGEGPHAPAPSYWPLFTGVAAAVAMCGLIVVNSVPFIAPLGAIALFICMIGWGVEPFEA
jgi:hypothetical protein